MTADYQKGYQEGFLEGQKRFSLIHWHDITAAIEDIDSMLTPRTVKRATATYWDAGDEDEFKKLVGIKKILTQLIE